MLSEKEKQWLKEGINWIPEKIEFERREGTLVCVRTEHAIVDIDSIEFIKKLGVVEDGITQDNLNEAFKNIKEKFG